MSLCVSDYSIQEELQDQVSNLWNSFGVEIHLYVSNVTINDSTTLAALAAAEASFGGYSFVSKNDFSTPTVTAHVASTQASTAAFTRSSTGSTQNVYGYYVTDSGAAHLLWAEENAGGPVPITNAGDIYTVTLRRTHQSKF